MGMSEAAQNSQRPKSGPSEILGINNFQEKPIFNKLWTKKSKNKRLISTFFWWAAMIYSFLLFLILIF
jgi:hypothetical protein